MPGYEFVCSSAGGFLTCSTAIEAGIKNRFNCSPSELGITFDGEKRSITLNLSVLEIQSLFRNMELPLLKQFPFQGLHPPLLENIESQIATSPLIETIIQIDGPREDKLAELREQAMTYFSELIPLRSTNSLTSTPNENSLTTECTISGHVLGETHCQASARKFIMDHAADFSGKTLVLEHLMAHQQEALDKWMTADKEEPLPPAILSLVRFFDYAWEKEAQGNGGSYHPEYNLEQLLITAKANGIKIVGFETDESLDPPRGIEDRILLMNYLVSQSVTTLENPDQALYLVGAAHGPDYVMANGFTVPGIQTIFGIPGTLVQDDPAHFPDTPEECRIGLNNIIDGKMSQLQLSVSENNQSIDKTIASSSPAVDSSHFSR